MFTAKNIVKRFGKITAVDYLSLEINTGETVGLLGPNGAGKTTTINMLIGLLAPDEGLVQIGESGSPLDHQVRRNIGIAPQALSLYEELTGLENLSFFARLYGLGGHELSERIDWALSFSGLFERRKSLVKTYSGGMKRRLNMACALLHEPRAVLFDEPTVGVDPQSRNHIFECIEQLKKELTIIYTTHYMEEAQRLCDRVAVIDHGQLLAFDTVDNLINTHGGDSVVIVEFEKVPGGEINLPGRLENTTLRVETDQPIGVIEKIAQQKLKYLSINIQRPDLESVFLNLTGRSLRD